jgi:transcription antitermination factor NusB
VSSSRGFTARTKARKRAVDVLFEAESRGLASSPRRLRDLLAERLLVTAAKTPLPAYSTEIVEGVADNLGRIDALISARERKGGLDRLPVADLSIMRVAVWEMLESDVAPIIAIDEAVSIAKAISTAESPALVNAILDGIRQDLKSGISETTQVSTPVVEELDIDEDLDDLLDEY